MRTLAFAILILLGAIPGHADILANSNFVDGRAHWKGDAKEIDTDNLAAGNQPGVTVTLNKDKWTKIYQTFSTSEKSLQYNVTFTLSSDYSVRDDSSEGGGGSVSGPSLGLDDIEGIYPLYLGSYGGGWTMVVEKMGGGYENTAYFSLTPDNKKRSSQSLTGKLRDFSCSDEMVIVLAFPPGQGTITLTGVSLKPQDQQDQ